MKIKTNMRCYCQVKFLLAVLIILFEIIPAGYCAALTDDFGTDEMIYDDFPAWGLSAALEFKSGDYGAQTTTRTLYIPFKLLRYFSEGMLSFTVPYIEQESEEQVNIIRGKSFGAKADKQLQTKTTESGLGDIILKGEYDLLKEEKGFFSISALGEIKLPTADENKGLGTGEYDFTLGIKNRTVLNNEWKIYAGVYYTFVGEPPDKNWDNELAFDLGFGYRVSECIEAQVFYEQSSAIVPGDADPKAVIIGVSCKLEENTRLFGDLSLGLSNGSADAGVSFGINVGF